MRLLFKSSLFRAATTYGGMNAFKQLIPFLLLPVLTHYLTPTDYGTLSMFSVVITFLSIFVTLNMDAAVGREYFEKDEIDFPNFTGNCLMFSAAICALVMVPAIYFFGSYTESFTGLPPYLLWPVLTVTFARYVVQILLVILQSGRKPVAYGIVQISQTFFEVMLALIFIVLFKMGLMGRVNSILVSTVVFALLALAYLTKLKWVSWRINPDYLKKALAFGIPLIPHVIGAIAINMTDRVLLMNMLGARETGLYLIGFQIGNIVNLTIVAFNQAWGPWLFDRLKQNNEQIKRNIVKFSYVYFLLALGLAFAVSVTAPFVFQFMIAAKFHEGLPVVMWVALGGAFRGMYYLVGTYITYVRKNHILSWVTLSMGLINLTVACLLIRRNGFIGAAQATALTHCLSFLITWYMARKVYPMPWNLRVAHERS